jgi:hypothetical protein
MTTEMNINNSSSSAQSIIMDTIGTQTDEYFDMKELEGKINRDLGFRYWKKYVSAAFWSNIATPVNLAITLMTSITTGQATTDNLLSPPIFKSLSIATLIISMLNTFFRPTTKMTENIKEMNHWSELGCRFERIYYNIPDTNVQQKMEEYRRLHGEINVGKYTQNPEQQNFFTDFLHIIVMRTCLKRKNTWLAD